MKKILIILTGVLLVYGEPVIAKNESTGITIVKKISKAKKNAKKKKYKSVKKSNKKAYKNVKKASQKKKKVKSAKKKVVKKKATKKTKYNYRYNVGENQSYAHKLVLEYGWTEADYQALVLLWNRESSWNPYAVNGNACGIPQSKPCSKMAKFGRDYRTNYKVQVNWGLDYIKNRYGTPSEAYRKFLERKPHWY